MRVTGERKEPRDVPREAWVGFSGKIPSWNGLFPSLEGLKIPEDVALGDRDTGWPWQPTDQRDFPILIFHKENHSFLWNFYGILP